MFCVKKTAILGMHFQVTLKVGKWISDPFVMFLLHKSLNRNIETNTFTCIVPFNEVINPILLWTHILSPLVGVDHW